jgi:TorA maturation chaperone TorD
VTAAAIAEQAAQRHELLRAVGAVADSPAAAASACRALGLADPGAVAHTDAFVMNCPPYAAIYLGADGGLGGEGADRVAGFWRAAGLTPPAEPDHLTALLSLYASLGEAAQEAGRPATAGALARARHALLWEHLWPWLPAYLEAVADLGIPALTGWAELALRVLRAEYTALASGQPGDGGVAAGPLPLALRAAPPPLPAGAALDDLLKTLTTPIRSGFILTRRRLAAGAMAAGAGHRIGERRFTLRAMLEQAPVETAGWLAAEAGRWRQRHAVRAPADPAQQWWAQRAGHTSRVLAAAVAAVPATAGGQA